MRVLMLSTPYPTHFTPMVPLAWGLRARGHEVMVLGAPEVAAAARSAGLCTKTIGEPFNGLELMKISLPDGVRPLQLHGRPSAEDMARDCVMWGAYAETVYKDNLEFARRFRPDIIIAETLEFSSVMLSETLDVPLVRHRWGIDPMGKTAERVIGEYLGIPCDRPAMVLDPCPESLQVDGISPGAPIRAVPFNGTGVMPPWWTSNGTRVCVSLGRQTVALNGAGLVRSVVHGIARLGVEVIVTVGDRVLDDIPGVRVVEPTPLGLFLSSCDVLIHHGGANTTMTAVTTGTPHIVLPQLADQFVAADRIVDAGVGLSIDNATGQDNPSVIGNVVSRVLNEPHFRRAATDLADTSARMPSPSAVVANLEALR